MLIFQPVTLNWKQTADYYFHTYGEGSCQHSFVSMFCMSEKYGDQICERDGYLFVLRSKKCTEAQRVYLFPMGDPRNIPGIRQAVNEVLQDAKEHGAAVCFETVTEQAKDLLLELFPGRFQAEYSRAFAEYLYSYTKLAELPGSAMASKRHDINAFYRNFGARTTIEQITPAHLDEIRAFQKRWLTDFLHGEEDVQLDCENLAIGLGLAHFQPLGLSGIVIRVDGSIAGYAYGVPLSDTHYDVIIEKGDRNIPDIYRILNQELVRRCCQNFSFINREEDLGVEGLRKAKLSYKPDALLEKYIVKEVPALE